MIIRKNILIDNRQEYSIKLENKDFVNTMNSLQQTHSHYEERIDQKTIILKELSEN